MCLRCIFFPALTLLPLINSITPWSGIFACPEFCWLLQWERRWLFQAVFFRVVLRIRWWSRIFWGASSGAAFGAALAIVLPTFLFSLQLSAFTFSLVAVFGAYALARVRGETPIVTLILAGVIVGALFSAHAFDSEIPCC